MDHTATASSVKHAMPILDRSSARRLTSQNKIQHHRKFARIRHVFECHKIVGSMFLFLGERACSCCSKSGFENQTRRNQSDKSKATKSKASKIDSISVVCWGRLLMIAKL